MVFDWIIDNRTYGKLDAMSRKLDSLIEGQKETNDTQETNNILKETNETLQETLKKIEIRYPQRRSAGVTPET